MSSNRGARLTKRFKGFINWRVTNSRSRFELSCTSSRYRACAISHYSFIEICHLPLTLH
jgi:hypothetical protein